MPHINNIVELLQVIFDLSNSPHASLNVIRFTQHRITQCRGNFPNTKSNYLIFQALGPSDQS